MRISDWSSDVCSSDLGQPVARHAHPVSGRIMAILAALQSASLRLAGQRPASFFGSSGLLEQELCDLSNEVAEDICQYQDRSEEHTSELQSLMRISYAVFCLKKKNRVTNTTTNTHN